MSQALTIRFATDVESAKKGMTDLAANIAGNMAKVSTSLLATGRTIDGSLAGTVARTAASIGALQIALAGGALAGFAILSAAIDQANEQLDRYIKLGKAAEKVGVDVEFYQRFTEALGGGKEAVDALGKSIEAVKPKFEEMGKVRQILGDLFSSGYTGNFVSQGLRQFDQAADDKGRIQAAVLALRELRDLGLSLESVKLGDALFGPEVGERIRQGKLDLDALAASLESAKDKDLITQEQVERAGELRDRIEKAKEEIANGVSVSISLEKAGRAVLEVWGDILQTVAKAFAGMNAFVNGIKAAKQSTLDQSITTLETRLRDTGMSPLQRKGYEEQLATAKAQRAATEGATLLPTGPLPAAQALDSNMVTTTQPPRPPPNIGAIREGFNKKAGGGGSDTETLDQIERFISQLERARDVAQAELDNIGKSNVEREKAVELAKAAAAARAAGRDLTDEETAKILRLAEAQQVLKDKIMDVRQAQAQVAETTRYFGSLATDALGSLIFDGAKASDVMKNLATQLAKAAIQAALMGTGPLAGVFGTAPAASAGSNAVGGVFGMIPSLFRAGGGDVTAGRAYTVGELGREMFIPDRNGRIVPIGAQASGGASGGAAPQMNVRVINNTPSQVSTRQGRDGSLNLVIDQVEGYMAERVTRGRGSLSQALSSRATGRQLRG